MPENMNPINDAKAIAYKYRARGVVILGFHERDYMAVSYGMTRRICSSLKFTIDDICELITNGDVRMPEGLSSQRIRFDKPDIAEELLAACEAVLAAAELNKPVVLEGEDSAPVYDDGSWFTLGVARQLMAAVHRAKGGA